jgi:hypothetical protein
MQNPHRALEAIDILTGSDFGLDVEWWMTDGKKGKDKMKLQMAKLITQIYMIAHAEGKCKHEDWSQIKYDILKNQTV